MVGKMFDENYFSMYASVGKALSNAHRLEILNLLEQSPKTVVTLADETGTSVANTSKHLQVLLRSRLVTNQRDGNFIYYSLAGSQSADLVGKFFEVAKKQVEEQALIKEVFLSREGESYELTMDELDKKVKNHDVVLIDVRPDDEYMSAHIPGAVSMPVEELAQLVEKLPTDKTIVAYCRGPHCLMSKEALKILEKSGRHAVRLKESVTEWQKHQTEKG